MFEHGESTKDVKGKGSAVRETRGKRWCCSRFQQHTLAIMSLYKRIFALRVAMLFIAVHRIVTKKELLKFDILGDVISGSCDGKHFKNWC